MIVHKKTMTELWHTVAQNLLFAEHSELDSWSGILGGTYDNLLTADSMKYDFDVGKDVWFTKYRFNRLQRDYLDIELVRPFIERSVKVAKGICRRGTVTEMPTRQVYSKDGRRMHTWGNCITSFMYHGGRPWQPPTFTMHSRTSFIGFLGPMDLALAWCLAREIAQRTGCEVEDFKFVWMVTATNWSCHRSIPYVVSAGHEEEVMDAELYPAAQFPVVAKSRLFIQRFRDDQAANTELVLSYRKNGDTGPYRYAQMLRMHMRWRRYEGHGGPGFPSIPVQTLTLLPACGLEDLD